MHHGEQHHHFHLISFKINKKLREIYATLSLRTFALSLAGIFIPIYLYTLGYSISQILIYMLVYHIIHGTASATLSPKLAKYFGVKHLMMLSMPFYFLFILGAAFLPDLVWFPYWGLAVLAGIANSLYWVGYLSEFAKFSDKKHRGGETSIFNILSSGAAALGPLIGGFVIVYLGYPILYALVFFFLIIAVIPLFMSKDFKGGKKEYRISKLFHKRSFRKDWSLSMGEGVVGTIFLSLWPLILYLRGSFGDVSGIGIVFTITFVVGMVGAFIVGKYADKIKNFLGLMKVSTSIFVGVWLLRALTNLVYLTEFIAGMFRHMLYIPVQKHQFNRASKSKNVVEYVAFKEITHHYSAAAVMLVLLLVGGIAAAPFIAAAAQLLFLLV